MLQAQLKPRGVVKEVVRNCFDEHDSPVREAGLADKSSFELAHGTKKKRLIQDGDGDAGGAQVLLDAEDGGEVSDVDPQDEDVLRHVVRRWGRGECAGRLV